MKKTSKYKEAALKAGYHPSETLLAAIEKEHDNALNEALIDLTFDKTCRPKQTVMRMPPKPPGMPPKPAGMGMPPKPTSSENS